ncbi:MAG: HAMP domain-containing protein [Rhodospirillales bacterium]|nr:HAMP domain-containing protein [Rhodospirillales bacterium]
MKIRGKVLSAIAFSLLATALANFFVLKTLVFPTFLELEQQAAARDVQRVMEAINSEIEDVDKTLWDYSSWDDSYRYAKGSYKSYPVSNLAVETLQNLRLDIVEIYDTKKTRLFAVVYDRSAGRTRQAEWKLAALADDGSLLTLRNDATNITGIMSTPDRPALFSSRPIVKTNGEGPAVGTFILGRFIDDDLVASIKDRIKVDFTLTPVEGLSGAAGEAYERLLRSDEPVLTQETADDQLLAYSLIKDLRGRPILLATATVKRDLSQIGHRVLSASLGGLALTAILVMAVLTVLLQWLLVGPLVSLTRHVVEIQAEGTPERRIGLPRRDEIGILAREFDRMLARLAEARDRLLDHSYQSGVAHMAYGVLHNLRNQLMPVNTRVERLRERVIERTDKHVDAAFAEIGSGQTPPDRRSKISAYLALSFDNMRETQSEVGGQLALVLQDLLRVEDVLGDLDRFSRVGSRSSRFPSLPVFRRRSRWCPPSQTSKLSLKLIPSCRSSRRLRRLVSSSSTCCRTCSSTPSKRSPPPAERLRELRCWPLRGLSTECSTSICRCGTMGSASTRTSSLQSSCAASQRRSKHGGALDYTGAPTVFPRCLEEYMRRVPGTARAQRSIYCCV